MMHHLYNADMNTVRHILMTPQSVLKDEESSQEDKSNTEYLCQLLSTELEYEPTAEEKNRKTDIFNELQVFIKEWIADVARSSKINLDILPFKGALFSFGSYRMEVSSRDADIDAVCVAPYFVSRETHFFKDLYSRLKQHPKVADLYKVTEVNVPLMKMKYNQVQIDILFAGVTIEFKDIKLDIMDLLNNKTLNRFDEKSLKPINGIRTAELILSTIPNTETFKTTLKLVKLWARKKGIYSNMLGYLGGVSWAILVSKICQMYPNYAPSKLLERFFSIYQKWLWDQYPVKVLDPFPFDIEDTKLNAEHFEELQRPALMKIMTPAFPSMNSAHNITETTLSVIKSKFFEANQIIQEEKNKKERYSRLFSNSSFFNDYPFFIETCILATNLSDLVVWRGYVESKLRKLPRMFEGSKYSNRIIFHLHPIPFIKYVEGYSHLVTYFCGIRLREDSSDETNHTIDMRVPLLNFTNMLSNYKISPSMNLQIEIIDRKKVSDELGKTLVEEGSAEEVEFKKKLNPKKIRFREGMAEPDVDTIKNIMGLLDSDSKEISSDGLSDLVKNALSADDKNEPTSQELSNFFRNSPLLGEKSEGFAKIKDPSLEETEGQKHSNVKALEPGTDAKFVNSAKKEDIGNINDDEEEKSAGCVERFYSPCSSTISNPEYLADAKKIFQTPDSKCSKLEDRNFDTGEEEKNGTQSSPKQSLENIKAGNTGILEAEGTGVKGMELHSGLVHKDGDRAIINDQTEWKLVEKPGKSLQPNIYEEKNVDSRSIQNKSANGNNNNGQKQANKKEKNENKGQQKRGSDKDNNRAKKSPENGMGKSQQGLISAKLDEKTRIHKHNSGEGSGRNGPSQYGEDQRRK